MTTSFQSNFIHKVEDSWILVVWKKQFHMLFFIYANTSLAVLVQVSWDFPVDFICDIALA